MLINARMLAGLLTASAIGIISCCPLAEYSTITRWEELPQGVPCILHHGSIAQITLVEIDLKEQKCLFEVTDLESCRKYQGWVELGDPIAFSPFLGTDGVILKLIKANSAVVGVLDFESKINLDLD